MRINRTKQRLSGGEAVFGCAVQHFGCAEVARLLAAAGFDYIFIDCEHGPFGLETVQDLVSASANAGITPVVRVAELLYSLVARFLDIGAQGVIFPRVEDPRLLEEAISWTKFPPAGKRGFGLTTARLDYEQPGTKQAIEHLNANTLVVVQFETRKALELADELLSIQGMDVAMIGPADLSISLGVPGQVDHPVLVDAVTRFVEACAAHHVAPGIHCANGAQAKFWLARGMRFVGAGGELNLMLETARNYVSMLRGAAATQA
jgi:2-keto-3-deoxy-L-rhamnonate aldolase RhmA